MECSLCLLHLLCFIIPTCQVNFNSKFGAQPRVGTLNPLASQKAGTNGGNGTGRRGAEKMGPGSMGAASMGACGMGGGVDARVQMPSGATGGGGGAAGGGASARGTGAPMGRSRRQQKSEQGAPQLPTAEGGDPGELDIGSRGGSGDSGASGQSMGESRVGGGLGRRRAASGEWEGAPERPPPEPKKSSRERRPVANGL